MNLLWDSIVEFYQDRFNRSIHHPQVLKACQKLWEKYNLDKLHHRPLTDEEQGSYLLLFWIPNVLRALKAVHFSTPLHFQREETWWDLGAGPLSCTLAWWLSSDRSLHKPKTISVIALDQSLEISKMAYEIIQSQKLLMVQLPDLHVNFEKFKFHDPSPIKNKNSPHRVFCTNVLGELRSAQCLDVISSLMAQAKESLFMLEPAKSIQFQRLITVRESICDRGFKILAPCTHSHRCPLLGLKKDRCYFEVPLPSNLKWHQWSHQIFKNKSTRHLHFSFLMAKREDAKGMLHAPSFSRVISDQVPTRLQCGYYICGSEGRHFLHARKSVEWKRGDLISSKRFDECMEKNRVDSHH